jgi:D-alanyl-D-alanine carboxypeptidase
MITLLLSLTLFQQSQRLSEQQAIAATKTKIDSQVAADRFSGVVLIAKAGKPIFDAAYGMADREKKIPNTVDTKIRFGSMGKMFTGVAIVQLVESGKLALDDPISKFIPDYPNKDVAAVTIYQLLTHTGGTGDFFGDEFQSHSDELKELKDYVALFGNRGLRFPPGTRWEYSNYGYILLGRIIEVASGQRYNDYVHDHIFEPAGMHATGIHEDSLVAHLAIGYSRGGPGAQQEGPLESTAGMAALDLGTSAGGGYSTVGDFLRFANALESHRLLNAHDTELLTTGKVDTPTPGARYAFGFGDQIMPDGVRRIGHSGGTPGQNGRLSIFPASGYFVVVLANMDPPAGDIIARSIDDRLPK